MKRFLIIQSVLLGSVVAAMHYSTIIEQRAFETQKQKQEVITVASKDLLMYIEEYNPQYIEKALAVNNTSSQNKPFDPYRNLTPSQEASFSANVSAYTAAYDETGSGDGITASGNRVRPDHTLACPREYPFGTKVHFEGYGTYICEDRGGAIRDNHFDVYMVTKAEAFAFGRRKLIAQIIE